MVPEANVTHVDTKTLSAAAGWQVEAAARALKAGWPKERILDLMARIGAASDSAYTLKDWIAPGSRWVTCRWCWAPIPAPVWWVLLTRLSRLLPIYRDTEHL